MNDYKRVFAADIRRVVWLARLRAARVAAGEMRAGNYGTEREYWQAECDRLDAAISQEESKR